MAGMEIASTSSAGRQPYSYIGFFADNFYITHAQGAIERPFEVVGGVVKIKSALIQNASITSAHIQDGNITNAKIANLSVDTIKIAGGSVTSMSYAAGGSGSVQAGGSTTAASVFMSMPAGSSGVVLTGYGSMTGTGGDCTGVLIISKNGQAIASIDVFVPGTTWFTYTISAFDSNPAGNNTYQLAFSNPTGGPGSNRPINYKGAAITATGGKR